MATAKNPFFVNIVVKSNIKYNGKMDDKMEVKKVLLLKIKNSTLIYSFPILV